MKVYMVADSHFGMRSNSPEWVDISAGWFEQDLIPELRKRVLPGDVFVHLGDVFDSRQSLNLLVQHRAIRVFELLSEIFSEVHVIAGNHDVMKRTTNDVSSLDCIKWIPNVRVHKEPTVVTVGGVPLLMMPWRSSPSEELDCVRTHRADYMFCHTSFLGMRLVGGHTVDGDAISADDLRGFKRVLSGHIHIRQSVRNVTMLGNPYQMTRSDGGDAKGWHVLDLSDDSLEFVENETSPKFKRIYLLQWEDRSINDLVEECRGHMVDLYVPTSYFVSGYSITSVSNEVSAVARTLEVVAYDDAAPLDHQPLDVGSQFSIMDMCRRYVSTVGAFDDSSRKRVEEKLDELYRKALER